MKVYDNFQLKIRDKVLSFNKCYLVFTVDDFLMAYNELIDNSCIFVMNELYFSESEIFDFTKVNTCYIVGDYYKLNSALKGDFRFCGNSLVFIGLYLDGSSLTNNEFNGIFFNCKDLKLYNCIFKDRDTVYSNTFCNFNFENCYIEQIGKVFNSYIRQDSKADWEQGSLNSVQIVDNGSLSLSMSRFIDDFDVLDSKWVNINLAYMTVQNGCLVTEAAQNTWNSNSGAALSVNIPGDFVIETQLTYTGRDSDLAQLFLYLKSSDGYIYAGVKDSWASVNPAFDANINGNLKSSGSSSLPASGTVGIKIERVNGQVNIYKDGTLFHSGNFTGTISEIRLTNTRYSTYNGKTAQWQYISIQGLNIYNSIGSYVSPIFKISLNEWNNYAYIYWDALIPNQTNLIVETNVSLDDGNTWIGWKQVLNGGKIPDIEGNNLLLQYRVTFSTSDEKVSPILNWVVICLTQDISGIINSAIFKNCIFKQSFINGTHENSLFNVVIKSVEELLFYFDKGIFSGSYAVGWFKLIDCTYFIQTINNYKDLILKVDKDSVSLIKLPAPDERRGYLKTVKLNLNVLKNDGQTGELKIAPLLSSWTGEDLTIVPSFGNPITKILTNVGGAVEIDISELSQNLQNGIIIYSTGFATEFDSINISYSYVYTPTVLLRPKQVWYNKVLLEWKPIILEKPMAFVKYRLLRGQNSDLSDGQVIFESTDISITKYEDHVPTGTYYYRLDVIYVDNLYQGDRLNFNDSSQFIISDIQKVEFVGGAVRMKYYPSQTITFDFTTDIGLTYDNTQVIVDRLLRLKELN